MKTFRLWLEKDPETPEFKRLAYEEINVSIRDVLLNGIHPWQGDGKHCRLSERFLELFNDEGSFVPELARFGHCAEVTQTFASYTYGGKDTTFEDLLESVRSSVRFVDRLNYLGLLKIAKRRLKEEWSHSLAYRLLESTRHGFDDIRAFLKAKDGSVKLRGYDDLNTVDLGAILSLEDFDGEDTALIAEGIPVANFRSASFLSQVTDENGRLRLVSSIQDFQLTTFFRSSGLTESLFYNCRREGEAIRLTPELNYQPGKRRAARNFAEKWRKGAGRYCFTTDVARLETMLDEKHCRIAFPGLRYGEPSQSHQSRGAVTPSETPLYKVGGILTEGRSANELKEILRAHGVSMTGRKADLVEKLALLAARLYKKHEASLDAYFSKNRFIRAKHLAGHKAQAFPVLDGLNLRNTVLAMYVLKHLRGNAILEATHNNDTYDHEDLARALISRKVSLTGSFLRVE